MARKKGVPGPSFTLIVTVIGGLSLDSDTLIINESVFIHFILFFTRNSRQDMKETTKNHKKHRQDGRNSRADTKRDGPCSMIPTRPTQPFDFLRAKTVWYMM
jgi:hypothetical protein